MEQMSGIGKSRLEFRPRTVFVGFTLIELLVTMVVAALLITIAVPSFNNLLQNNTLVTTTNSLQASIGLARSEAVKRGQLITLRAIGANPAGSDSNEWGSGWCLYQGNPGVTNCDNVPAADMIQRLVPSSGIALDSRGSGQVINFIFTTRGALSTGAGAILISQEPRSADTDQYCVRVLLSGQASSWMIQNGSGANGLNSCQ